jgi:hypothetical protein
VNINTTEPVTIINSRLKGPGDLLHYYLSPTGPLNSTASLTVQQSCFVGTNPNVAGQYKGTPLWVQNAVSVLVENCDFESGGFYGIWVEGYVGNNTLNNTITIRNNRINNVDGRASDGNGGYLTTIPQGPGPSQPPDIPSNWSGLLGGHAIFLSDVHGVPGIDIAWNQIINEPYQSFVGDSINMYDSSGTPASPIEIHDNYIQGGYEPDPATANTFNYGGAGITMDGSYQTDPSLVTSFVEIYDNQTVSESRGGFNISVGHDIEVYSNRVVSNGQLADGTNYSLANGNGIGLSNYVNDPPGVFGNNSFHDNLSGFRFFQKGGWQRYDDYFFNVAPTINVNNASWTPTTTDAPTLIDEADESLLWEEKLIANGTTVGSALEAVCPKSATKGVSTLSNRILEGFRSKCINPAP